LKFQTIADGSVTSAKGFFAGSVHAGFKKANKDLVILYSELKTSAAAAFTQNRAAAPPVSISREIVGYGDVRAVLINSGNANACTGLDGFENARMSQAAAAKALSLKPDQVALASTGVIGVPLPMEVMMQGIPKAVAALGPENGHDAALGIMTTDLSKKEFAVRLTIDGKKVTIGGMAKGSGMINPNMATMLSFVTTDAAVDPGYLKEIVAEVVESTYNMITVDGDTSTNDTIMVLANGMAGNKTINEAHTDKELFIEALYAVNEMLAISIVKDGEGATKLIEVEASDFQNKSDARIAAKAVLNSNLVKTAIFGEDGNWGRIICSLGYSGASFDLNDVRLELANGQGQSVKVFENGLPTDYDEAVVTELLKDTHIIIRVNAGNGYASARGWGCDLSYDYVKINGSYRN
jgi:glutamate N-acetyltransferase / amino-acid N-acetyltransferase